MNKENTVLKSCEPLVSSQSDYYVHVPSACAREMFFYPLYTGHFIYQPGYSLYRESYDSFLLMYLEEGELEIVLPGKNTENLQTDTQKNLRARTGDFVLINCYRPHAYMAPEGCDVFWCHFDGSLCLPFYREVTGLLGNVFSMKDPVPALNGLKNLYTAFAQGRILQEALLSKYLHDILIAFLSDSPDASHACPPRESSVPGTMEEVLTYMGKHFAKDLPVSLLASKASLSEYHFIRSFKRETGFTPHEYLINLRISTAKYLLKNSVLPVKEICFQTGFSCESVFCSAFKKHTKMTPSEYRKGLPPAISTADPQIP